MDAYTSDTISYKKTFLYAVIFIVMGFAATFFICSLLIKSPSAVPVATSIEKNVEVVDEVTSQIPSVSPSTSADTETIQPDLQSNVSSGIATTSDSTSTSTTTSSPTNIASTTVSTIYAPAPEKSTPKSNTPQQQALPKATSTTIPVSKPEIFKLSVPYFYQEYANSCEASALRMALAYYGVITNDMEITRAFGYSPHLKDIEKNVWDDPQEMFVGFIDGIERNQGYGVYGEPVLKSLKEFGRTGEYKTSITSQYLAKEIKAGHPIVIWGYTNISVPYTWTSPTGKTVKAFKGEHARLIVGVKGPAENPLGFYLHDPQTEAQYEYWDTQKLFNNIYSVSGVTNQAVVVR